MIKEIKIGVSRTTIKTYEWFEDEKGMIFIEENNITLDEKFYILM